MVLVGGCLVYQQIYHRHVYATQLALGVAGEGKATRSSHGKAAEDLVKEARANPGGEGPEEQARLKKADEAYRAEAQRLLAGMTAPADFPAALAKELEGWAGGDLGHAEPSPRIAALMTLWLRQDPAGLSAWLGDENFRGREEVAYAHLGFIAAEALRNGEIDQLATLMKGDKHSSSYARSFAAQELGQDLNREQLLAMKAALPEEKWNDFSMTLVGYTPQSKSGELTDLAVAENLPRLLTRFAQMHDQGPWLADLIGNPALSKAFREALSDDHVSAYSLLQDPRVAPERRIPYLTPQEKLDPYAALAESDAGSLLGDWAYRLRTGQATAEEALAGVKAGTPEVAEQAPEELRRQVLLQLEIYAPEQALAAMSDLPPEERYRTALLAAIQGQMASPEVFLEILQQVPVDAPDTYDRRLDAWSSRASRDYERLGESYVEWVRGLPPGVDRDMALATAAKQAQHSNPGLAADLRGEVSDPKLQHSFSGH
ncbi:MAG: hypothetical protein JWO82_2911 [Akkermansiaceae bacterium]|nr:hypothetical protein [Akkermansiaceae bacterium]